LEKVHELIGRREEKCAERKVQTAMKVGDNENR